MHARPLNRRALRIIVDAITQTLGKVRTRNVRYPVTPVLPALPVIVGEGQYVLNPHGIDKMSAQVATGGIARTDAGDPVTTLCDTSYPGFADRQRAEPVERVGGSPVVDGDRVGKKARHGISFLTGHAGGAFGTAGSGSPASPRLTRPARKSAKGTIFSPTLACSRASMYRVRSSTGMTVHGYPPDASIRFIRNRPMRPLPSI